MITRVRAIRRLTSFWAIATLIFGLLLMSQVLAGKYGDDAGIPFNWISAQIFPVLGLLLAAAFSSPDHAWSAAQVDRHRYLYAKLASGVQILGILLILLAEPLLPETPFELFDRTILYFSLWQGVVTACVGALVFDGR